MLNIDNDNNIYLTRGDTCILDIEITDKDGDPYIMTPNDELIFAVRRLAGKGEVLIRKEISVPVITLTTNDTKNLSFGKYKFDIHLYNSGSHVLDTFIADKIFELGEEVHDFEHNNR